MKSKHEGVGYKCDQCDYSASHSSTLKIHKKSQHEGVKYRCNQCDYIASQSSNLKVHKKSKHEGLHINVTSMKCF